MLISPVLACVIGNTLRVRERHNSGRRIIQDIPSPRSYNRQECWIIKTQNPGLARAECDGEPALASSQWANCSGATPAAHDIIVTRCEVSAQWRRVACAGVSWTCDVLTSDPVTSVTTIRHQSLMFAANNKEPADWLHSTHRCAGVCAPCVCVLINNSAFIGCGEAAAGGGEWFSICVRIIAARHGSWPLPGLMWDERERETGNIRERCDHCEKLSLDSASEDRVSEPEPRDPSASKSRPMSASVAEEE